MLWCIAQLPETTEFAFGTGRKSTFPVGFWPRTYANRHCTGEEPMSKSITSTWLRGLGKLAQIQMRALRNAAKRGERAVIDMTSSTLSTHAPPTGKKKATTAKGAGKTANAKRSDTLGTRSTVSK